MTTTVIILGIAALASNVFLFWYAKRVNANEKALPFMSIDENSETKNGSLGVESMRLAASVAAELQNAEQDQSQLTARQVAGSSKQDHLNQA
jgi:hypothetical protein